MDGIMCRDRGNLRHAAGAEGHPPAPGRIASPAAAGKGDVTATYHLGSVAAGILPAGPGPAGSRPGAQEPERD